MTEIKSLQCRPKQCISYITYHFAGISLSSFTSRNDKKILWPNRIYGSISCVRSSCTKSWTI